MAKLTPEELQDATRFTPLVTLEHDKLADQLKPYVARWNLTNAGFGAAVGVFAALAGYFWGTGKFSFGDGFAAFGWGVILCPVVLLPVHEHVHALAYRLCGARTTRVEYRWRQLIAVCTADRFVTSRREMVFVALAPFVVVSVTLTAAALLSPPAVALALASAAALHGLLCGGDFALVNLVTGSGPGEVFSYDDVPAQKTLFFRPAVVEV